MKSLFLYDGDCNFCKKLAMFWSIRTDSQLIEFTSFRDFNEAQLKQIHPQLTIEKCESEVQLIEANKRLPGFFAVRRMMFWSKQFKYLAPFLYLPLVPFLGIGVMYFLKRLKSTP